MGMGMMPMEGMGMGGGFGLGMMPVMGMSGMSTEQLKEYQKNDLRKTSNGSRSSRLKLNEEVAKQMAQQVNEFTKHAAEYAFDTPQS